MTAANSTTNGASLEDCHTNFFSLTDVCGIKWSVLRSSTSLSPSPGDPLDDPILAAFSRALEAGLLAVWRRVPRRHLVTYSFDPAGNQVKKSTKGHDEKNQLSQVKELWLFWYGEKPEAVAKLVGANSDLQEVAESSGSWESGIPYEARTLLFKAVNNLIERSLLSKEFVRLGKWFVQPYDGSDRVLHKGSHLSFSFQYFVHGESAVCTSVDVRQHPPVRRLTHAHLATAASLSASVQVLLSPYGMAGTLTGVQFGTSDPAVRRLLEEWAAFWPLSRNSYSSRDPVSGEQVAMPAAVEVLVGGVRLVYPTSYVLVTDLDCPGILQMQEGEDGQQPTPFTASSHPLFQPPGTPVGRSASERVHTDSVLPDSEMDTNEGGGDGPSSQVSGGDRQSALQSWDYLNPTSSNFRRTRPKPRVKTEREFRSARWRGGNPLFRRAESIGGEGLVWGLDQDSLCSPATAARIDGGVGSGVSNNRVPSEGLHRELQSPASNAPHTPGPGGPRSVGPGGLPLMSPHTPAYTPGGAPEAPNTPFTPGGPKSCGPSSVPSPYRARDVNPPLVDRKVDLPNPHVSPTSATKPSLSAACKRPALPAKEYEEASDQLSLTSAYDYSAMTAWLSHPVKKSRLSDGPREKPLQPMFRRRSQHNIFAPVYMADQVKAEVKPMTNELNSIKLEPKPLTNGLGNNDGLLQPKKEVVEEADGKPGGNTDLDIFSTAGLKPSLADLDNMFEDSDNDMGCVPTPPASVQPHVTPDEDTFNTKVVKRDPPGNLPSDQLHQMFPTPPSHEHPGLHSPGDGGEEPRTPGSAHIKQEPSSPRTEYGGSLGTTSSSAPAQFEPASSTQPSIHSDIDSYFDHTVMLATSKFAPLPPTSLPSSLLPALPAPQQWRYKPAVSLPSSPQPPVQNNSQPQTSVPSLKPGLSPISPSPSVDLNPRSNKSGNPGSCEPGFPRSVGPTTPRSALPHTPLASGGDLNAPTSTSTNATAPPANALTINLVLSDSLLNLYRDINFNSCTMCVCTNDGNIKGGESLLYLPQFAGEEDFDCKCGYSAVMNRKLSHLAGMFLEDEREVTGIQEDLYFKKRLSLLLLDPKCQEQGEHRFNERALVVDSVGQELVSAVHQQAGLSASRHSSLIAYSQQYLRSVSSQQPAISYIEELDGTDTVWSALETVRASATSDCKSDLEASGRAGCLHKWAVLPSPGPSCSEDIVRVMKCLLPILEVSLHVRAGKKTAEVAVEGPLTWRQFHRMAGVTTKGNTDDGCEPLPIPSVTVGYEREWMTVSPLSLYYWDSLAMEPWAPPRDVAYIVLAPDNDNLLSEVKTFFKVLSNGYESLKLGRHASGAKTLRDGVLKVGSKLAQKLESEPLADDWFSAIGDTPNADLLRLYSKVCHHYLVPLLATIPLDSSLLKRPDPVQSAPPETLQEKVVGENGEGSNVPDRESQDTAAQDDGNGEPPAIVVYIVDPFSFGVDNPELMRLSNIALLRCFNNMVADTRLPSDSLRQSLFLQTISLESIYSLTGEMRREGAVHLATPGSTPGSRATALVRDLCMSVYTQSQRPLAFNTSTKTLTGFGPASSAERYLKGIEQKPELVKHLYTPPFVLALPSQKNKKTSDAEEAQRSTVLFVTYCLSDDQRHLLASLADDRGEMVRTTVINVHIPNRSRRKKASARRVGLKKLLDWILSVMALSLVPWRLVIGRLGRIGHGELRGWSALLSRKSLKKAVKQLKDQCTWKSDLPTLLSVCLISMEPDTVLRVMHEQFTPDERFGGNAATCTLSTPKDATATHILVFPTSATAQSAVQAAFNDHQTGGTEENDFELGVDFDDMDMPTDNDNEGPGLGLGDLNDIFNDDPFSNAGGESPTGADPGKEGEGEERDEESQLPGSDPAFRYGQEVPGERLEILQQPLALGYLASTAATGPMPRWFWAAAPHLESVCPVFLKSALHINIANLAHGGDDGLGPGPGQSRHSLDSNFTTDVLRYVLEGYNALSWLVLDPVTHDRRSCLPIHVQTLLQLYHAMAALV